MCGYWQRAQEDENLQRLIEQRLKLSAKVIIEDLPPPEVEEYDEFPGNSICLCLYSI